MLLRATWSASLPSWCSVRLLLIVGVLLPIKIATLWHALHRQRPRIADDDYVRFAPGRDGEVLTIDRKGAPTWTASKTLTGTGTILVTSATQTLTANTASQRLAVGAASIAADPGPFAGSLTIGPSYPKIEIDDRYTCKQEGKRTICRLHR